MSFFGKIKVIDELMWLRTAENPSNTAGFELEFHSWFTDAIYAQEVDDFLSRTASSLVIAGMQDFHSVRDGLARACLRYVEYCAGKDASSRSLQAAVVPKGPAAFLGSILLKRAVRKIISRLPSPLTAMLPARLRFRPYVEIAKGLESVGLRVDWSQLNIILETVKKSHGTTN